MKNKYFSLLGLAIMIIFTACNDDDVKIVMPEPAKLISSNPADGATNISHGDLSVVLTYDQYVFCPNSAVEAIQINGAKVEAASSATTQLTIKLSGLEKGKEYTLVVPDGAVWGPAKVDIPSVSIKFSTVDESELGTALVAPNASVEAQNIFNYMHEVYGNKTISGSMAQVAWNIDEAQRVYALTGKYPAMTHFDYIHLWASPANWIDYSDITVAENWWNDGGIIGASWHWMVPKYEGAASDDVTYDPNQTTFSVNNALTEGTWENGLMKADLEKMAGYLKLMQEKGIPVVWRPLHEAAGNTYEYTGGTAWFWWGSDGADAYKRLWIHMFDYFNAQGLNNLIWVWTSQTKDSDFYPGDEYVDIIARDMYGKNASESLSDFNELNRTFGSKLLCLGENGAYIDDRKELATITEMWNAGAKWLYFMPWYDNEGATMQHANDNWWLDAMNNENVISRDQLPSFK